MKCLVIVPTINELANLRNLLPEILNADLRFSVLIVDDASSDGTIGYISSMAKADPRVHLISRNSRLGVGSAHVAGLRYASTNSYEHCITMDADFTHDPSYLVALDQELTSDPTLDCVIASRFMSGGGTANWSAFRRVLTHAGHLLSLIFLGTTLDASSGFRAYKVARLSPDMLSWLSESHYEFFFKSTFFLKRMGYKVKQIPVTLNARAEGHSNMKFGHAVRSLWSIMTMRVTFPFTIRIARGKIN